MALVGIPRYRRLRPRHRLRQYSEPVMERRPAKKLSQGSMKKRTGFLRGYVHCCVSRVENGHTTPSIETLGGWAKALEVEVQRPLLEGE